MRRQHRPCRLLPSPNDKGNWTGLDVDYCKAVAAAVFGDATKVEVHAALRQGPLHGAAVRRDRRASRNSTWTITRDTSLGLNFAGVNYYDGQGFMVKKKLLGVTSALELAGASVCVQSGTTTELNLADYFKANNLEFTPVVFEKLGGSERGL